MNCDELLMMCSEPNEVLESNDQLMVKKERLYSLAVSGKTKQFLGKEFSCEQIQNLSPEDINRYYSRYEAQLGSKMIKSLGQTLINLYAKAVSKLVSIDSEQDLKYDLSQDPLLSKGLESVGCDLYYRFGGLLAPLSMGLITFNHIDLNNLKFWLSKNERPSCDDGTPQSNGEQQQPDADSREYSDDP